MKVKGTKTLNVETDIKITGITLLSIEEHEKYEDKIPLNAGWWWLRSPGDYPDDAASVNYDGSVYYDGHRVSRGRGGVRPILKGVFADINGFEFADHSWIVLAEDMAICKDNIGLRRFDAESNDYEKSEIKQWLENWLKEALESEE